MPRRHIDPHRADVGDGVEVITAPWGRADGDGAVVWLSKITGGKLDGLMWQSANERQAVDRHVLLTKIARLSEEL